MAESMPITTYDHTIVDMWSHQFVVSCSSPQWSVVGAPQETHVLFFCLRQGRFIAFLLPPILCLTWCMYVYALFNDFCIFCHSVSIVVPKYFYPNLSALLPACSLLGLFIGLAEWVRALAWTGSWTVPAGFESHCGNLFASELWQFRIPFTPLCQCLSEETLKAVGPFYQVSMPGEVKDPTSPHWNVYLSRRKTLKKITLCIILKFECSQYRIDRDI